MNDSTKESLMFAMAIVIVLCSFMAALTYNAHGTKETLRAMVESGADPVAASCALNRTPNVCLSVR